MNIREQIEQMEIDTLSPYASFSCRSEGRSRPEKECDIRTVYQRDRDRILHCKAFRRLKDKTQVFLSPQGDHYRTRLTHTLEVSQIARTIARALNLNVDLVEAVSLGHDVGHTPFGHAGERALNILCPEGFRHNKQSIRVLNFLENDGKGLNLTREVLDGIENHQMSKMPSTLEGQVVRLSDKIAYIHHDMDDAQRAGMISEDDIPITVRMTLGFNLKERLDKLVHDIIENSLGKNQITMSDNVAQAMKMLRRLMYEDVYKNDLAKSEESKVYLILKVMYEYYNDDPEHMPEKYQNMIREGHSRERVVCDYIAGMTDQYCIRQFKDIYIPEAWDVY
ncbi:MAG TPA: deoxyguanosinetriphosphate triphosphohydrolase [Lachnospiraceae bacterium]|nr:deoxyguanosinetriphosphate triphosphohydrolase [Lachnospiraceae bacterium]